MVNTGKPSGGCKLCRARRIKCDEGKPFCLRCKKSRRQCPGYRDPFEANIRDETEATIKRFKKSRGEDSSEDESREIPSACNRKQHFKLLAVPKCKKFAYENPSLDSHFRLNDDNTEDDDEVPPSIFTSIDEQASCYFLSEFIIVPEATMGRGYYRFIPWFLSRTKVSKCFSQAYKAVSLAALAGRRTVNASSALFHAQNYYLKAVRAVNEAIVDPEEVKDDQTLAAVLMLAFYEMLNSTRDSVAGYTNHMKGAAIIVKLRGRKGLETVEGGDLFSITRNQCFSIHCLPNSSEVADFTWLLQHDYHELMQNSIANMNIQSSQLRQEADRTLEPGDRKPETVQKVMDILERARALEAKFRELNNNPSPQWRIDTIDWVHELSDEELDTTPTFTGPVYDFDNFTSAVLHLAAWCCHLLLTTTILRCMAWLAFPGDYRAGKEYEGLKRSATLRIEDIVAMAPYFYKWKGSGAAMGEFPCGITSPDSPTRGAAGMMVLWPLLTAFTSDFADPRQRRFLRGRLKYLADVIGIRKADVFIHMEHNPSPSREIERDRLVGAQPQ